MLQYPEGFVRVYQQPYNPSVNQDPPDESPIDEYRYPPDSQQQDLQPVVEVS